MGHRSPGYSITVRLRYADIPGSLGRITSAIGQAAGYIGTVDVVDTRENSALAHRGKIPSSEVVA